MKFNTRDWSRSIQRRFPLHWNTLDHGTLEPDLFGLVVYPNSSVQSSPAFAPYAREDAHA